MRLGLGQLLERNLSCAPERSVSNTGSESEIFPARSGSVNFAAKTSLALRVENIALRLYCTELGAKMATFEIFVSFS